MIRQLPRGNLRINTGRDDSPSPSDTEEESEHQQSPPRRSLKRKGKEIRGSHTTDEVSGSSEDGSDDAESEQQETSHGQQQAHAPEIEVEVHDGEEGVAHDVVTLHPVAPTFMQGITFRVPLSAPNRRKINYKSRGKTEEVRKEKAKDPRAIEIAGGVDYRFTSFFQQDLYESALIKKDHPVARSQWIDWAHMESLNNDVLNEVIEACKEKHIYRLMEYRHDWNREVICQFYATCYFEESGNVRRVHWRTEGQWYKISFKNFARLFGFGDEDLERHQVHLENHLSSSDMDFMYLPGEQGNRGTTHGMIPFYAYMNRLMRKTLLPREGDASKITKYTRNLLKHLTPTSPAFSVSDFIWEEIKDASFSPQKSCPFGPLLMHVIEQVTNLRFSNESMHKEYQLKHDLEGPSLREIREGLEDLEMADAQHSPPAAPSPAAAPSRSTSSRRSPPSPIKKAFNFLFGMCKSTSDVVHKEREKRKKDTIRLKKIQAALLPNDPPSPPGSDEVESEPESLQQQFQRFQQLDYYSTLFPYGDAGAGSSSAAPAARTPPPAPADQSQQQQPHMDASLSGFGDWLFTGAPPQDPPAQD